MCKLLNLKHLSIAFILILNSCGFISDTPIDKEIYQGSTLSSDCNSDLSGISFNDFLNEDIEYQLSCLSENLDKFSKYVKVKNPDYIGSDELSKFIQQFFKTNSSSLLNSIKLMFKINMLLLRDPEGQISKANLRKLFKLLIIANKEAINITTILDEINKIDTVFSKYKKKEDIPDIKKLRIKFWRLKVDLHQSIKRLSDSTLEVIQVKTARSKNINIKRFIKELNKNYKDINIEEELVESILFIKPLLLGGSRENLNSNEIVQLFEKLPTLFKYAFNFTLVDERYFKHQYQYKSFNLKTIEGIERILFPLPLNLELANLSQIETIVRETFSKEDPKEQQDLIDLVKSFKYNVISKGNKFLVLDLKKLISVSKSLILMDQTLSYINLKTDPLNAKSKNYEVIKVKEKVDRRLKASTGKLSNIVKSIFFPDSIGVKNFMDDLRKHTSVLDEHSEEEINTLLKLKPLLLAGEVSEINKDELEVLFQKLPSIFNIIFDLNITNKLEENSLQRSQEILTNVLKTAKKTIAKLINKRVILSLYDVSVLMKKFLNKGDYEDFKPFLESAVKLKENIYPIESVEVSIDPIHKVVRSYEAFHTSQKLFLKEKKVNEKDGDDDEEEGDGELEKIFNILPLVNTLEKSNPYFKTTFDVSDVTPITDKDLKKTKFTYLNIVSLVNDIDAVVSMNYFNKLTYEALKAQMESIYVIDIDKIKIPELKEYKIFTPTELEILKNEFKFVAANFRYFRDTEVNSSYFGHEYKRSLKGFTEVAQIYWALKKVMRSYGHVNNSLLENKKFPFTLSKAELDRLFLDMKPVLVKFKLWSAKFDSFSRNAILLSDLFQSISNGDTELGAEEATEYSTLALSAMSMRDNVFKSLTSYCEPIYLDTQNFKNNLFDSKCARDNFYNIMFNDLKYESVLPLYHSYYVNESVENLNKYQSAIEGFARDFPDISLPMNYRDMILKIGSMLNVESVFVRYDKCDPEEDKDQCFDNELGNDELDKAFEIYKDAIIKVSKLPDKFSLLAKPIFFYMLKNMKKPTKTALAGSILNPLDNKVKARRLNIGTLLYYMVKEANNKSALPIVNVENIDEELVKVEGN